MQTGQWSDDLLEGLAAVERLARGELPDAASIELAASALATLVERNGAAGARDEQAQTAALLATALRIGAGLADGDSHNAAFLRAHEGAVKARDQAIEAATKNGVNNVNLTAYVRATSEAALCALALGEAVSPAEGTALLTEAADLFAEAGAGYRRLGREGNAKHAEIKALEARSRRALRS